MHCRVLCVSDLLCFVCDYTAARECNLHCQNGGTCDFIDVRDGLMEWCDCSPPWSGRTCEVYDPGTMSLPFVVFSVVYLRILNIISLHEP